MKFSQSLRAALLGSGVAYAAIPSISGYSMTWGDDFIGSAGSLPSTANWIIDQGTGYPGGPASWGTGEVQSYTSSPDNLRLDGNGRLRITALRNNNAWTSARIETQRTNFVCALGKRMRIQASISLPDVTGNAAAGIWPAFWTLGGAYRGNYQNWPGIGEFDILENVNGVNRVWGTLHCGTAPDGPCKEFNGLGGFKDGCPGSPCQGNFHTYTFEVDRTQSLEAIRWFVDGVLFWQVISTDIPASEWNRVTQNGHFLLLNLAVGGSFPDGVFGSKTPLAETASGKFMEIDYVAVYNSN